MQATNDVATIDYNRLIDKRYISSTGEDVTNKYHSAMNKAWGGSGTRDDNGQWAKAEFAKADTFATSNGLVAINLVPSAEVMVPQITPIRNKLPRTKGAGAGPQWRQVTALSLSGSPYNPFVDEKRRGQRITAKTVPLSGFYKSAGIESDVTFEAQHQGVGFDDMLQLGSEVTLLQAMMMEEAMIVCSNSSLALGVTPTPTAAAATSTTGPAAGVYSVICIAGTAESYINCSTATGTPLGAITVIGADNATYVINGGIAGKSAAAPVTTTAGNLAITAFVAPVKGAFVYYWFIGVAGAEKLEAVTTNSAVTFNTVFAGTGVAASTYSTTDYSVNTRGYDGLFYLAINDTTGPNNTALAYYNQFANGATAGTGKTLTVSPRGTVNEIDAALSAYWTNFRTSPSVIYCHAQELGNIYNKVLTNGNQALVRFTQPIDPQNPSVTVGQTVGFYVNPYCVGGPVLIPIVLHPFVPAGSLLFMVEDPGPWYPYAKLGNAFEMQCIADYYAIPWPYVDRSTQIGIYWESYLLCKWRALLGVITNIANG